VNPSTRATSRGERAEPGAAGVTTDPERLPQTGTSRQPFGINGGHRGRCCYPPRCSMSLTTVAYRAGPTCWRGSQRCVTLIRLTVLYRSARQGGHVVATISRRDRVTRLRLTPDGHLGRHLGGSVMTRGAAYPTLIFCGFPELPDCRGVEALPRGL
jgi:hypothetical protein